ncbi:MULTISPECIES: alkene reductase [unclassified Caballeronia]|uniref:alkene reductase n=1 Tax=unclassified Caballeronia TaxID=2646786 RepID=UPI0028635867|nr:MULTISPECIES: alkene reductase [unclassified Caballeronia]MDR5776497.1 alkene reductase [Caballeronia sp. LZ002]MDR5851721.1 alkene reductase [Caballeronia sp. LZ003]
MTVSKSVHDLPTNTLSNATMKILEPFALGPVAMRNRVVMAPMTRSRADSHGLAGPLMREYYKQRASMGLIISEGLNTSPQAIGVPSTPGIYTDAQIASWRKITDAVHDSGGAIFAQLWHTGRVGHSSWRNGSLPVGPSAIRIEGQKPFTAGGIADFETPHELSVQEIVAVVADYRRAAENARSAGFDGVELHAAFGYLPNQFLDDNSNKRADLYGGSIANRCRFTLEVMDALLDVCGVDRVGIKLSPAIAYNGMADSDPRALYSHLITELSTWRLAYLHLMRPMFPLDHVPHWPKDVLGTYAQLFDGPIVANAGYTPDEAEEALLRGDADLISFGTLALANPDLPARIASLGPFNEADRNTLYAGGSERGYTDYPALPNR